MTTATLQTQPSFLKKNLFFGVTISTFLVIAIMVFSFAIHMYNIESIGDANAYYTAAVESMLKSWSNFFFVAAEPGGSVSVDKPPLGLWIEAVFAYFLGVSGFSVSLPNILAGVFGIPLLYAMVKKYMGELAGLVAAFVMAITPVFVATNRNNTMDGLLVFFLLLAAWAFIKATESGKLTWLLLGAFIVGLGFNIKMLQAFLPLPAFYALYFFGSKEGWLRKIINLGIATILLAAVSLSWAVVVDLVPADSRPYIGSSGDNTVMGLIFGHNGISRLESNGGGPGGGPQNGQPPRFDELNASPSAPIAGTNPNQATQPQQNPRQGPPQEALAACANSTQGASCSFTLPNGNSIDGSCITPPNSSELACAPQGMIPQEQGNPAGGPVAQGPAGQGGGTPFSQETGVPGVLRFFTQPLSRQMSWLLPFALISVLLALFASRIQLPIESGAHKALILWGGWLLICVVFFSMVSGIFHAYYAIMLAPSLGAMVGIGFTQVWSWSVDKKWVGILLAVSAALTIGFQYFATTQYNETSWWMLGSGILLGLGIIFMVVQRRLAYVTILAAMMVIPLYWTIMTVVSNSDINLPTAYTGNNQAQDGVDRARQQPGSNVNTEMLAYLEANTQGMEYLVAVPSSQQGAQFVLATGRPVLYMGGFGGQDEVVNADDLAKMVANGELRYVLYGGERGNKADIANWLKSSCVAVLDYSQTNMGNQQNQRDQAMTLYMCK
ncbi:MAG: glycosyltransferase family 39 protein [Anaerolineales bacterium]|nr:glycosyltransferase family 39 protein [Anaerolineales bacterium]